MPFDKINVDYTLNVINKIKNISKKIIVYSTSELYNLHSGPVGVHSTPYYTYTPYIASKELMVDKINKLRHKEHLDIIIITPFTFNSPYRSGGFLYNRFLSVILEGKKIEIGNIDFERDMVHPSVVAKASFTSDKDIVVGSGVLTNIRQFYVDLLKNFSINYDDYVTENNDIFINKRKPYFASTYTPYTNLLNDTTNDIKKYKNSISKRHN
jgi:nucleoside-diphosphate-sugar epimerase